MTQKTIAAEIIKQALCSATLHDELLPDKVTISIDSRTLRPMDIFIALRGEFDDGHRYILDALKRNASLVVAEKRFGHQLPSNKKIVFVENTLNSFSEIAKLHLASLQLLKVAITGSNGKTTTKEMLRAALSNILGNDQVYANPGNRNNHFGVPLSALEVTNKHRIAIFEMGMNHSNEISNLCTIVSPNIGIITNISHAHEGNFVDGIEGVQRAKGELFEFVVNNGGTLVINIDDPRVRNEALRVKSEKTISFGRSPNADMRISAIEPYSLNSQYQTAYMIADDGVPFPCKIPLLGEHQAMNAAAALAVVKALLLSAKDASLGLMAMEKIKGRMNVIKSSRGYVVLNDSYNANPVSMNAGIAASLEITAKRRIAAIGAMGELGKSSAEHHFELGKTLGSKFDFLFICGASGAEIVAGAKSVGMPDKHIVFRMTASDLVEPLTALVKDEDVIFVKGSLSANMQLVASALED